jgi:TolA-binding protein
VVDIPAEQPEAAEQPAPPVEAAAAESQAKEPLTANGLYQQAQSYEARSPSRDIRQALALYQQLVDTFPASPLAQDAQKRIIYLKRFYFEIP